MSGQSPSSHNRENWVAAQRLASHAVGVRLEDLPQQAREAVANFTLDTIGVGVAGAASAYAASVVAAMGGRLSGGRVGLWGGGPAADAPEAAFINAYRAHCQEFDCVHEGAVLHPFTVVTPVLLAEAARVGMTGETYMAACAAGVDVAAGLGIAATSPIRFFRPATCGLFGAVAALARARSLDPATAAHAFGYALAFASGTMQAHIEGTPTLALQVANAARNAFLAVDLAQAGLPGPLGAIDGPFGYLSLFESSSAVTPVLESLGKIWRVSEVSWKPHPTGRAAHGGIALMADLRAQGVAPEMIRSLTIRATPLIHHLVGRPIHAPLEVNYARLCLPYCAAYALRHGGLGLEAFTPSALSDPVTHALAARITVEVVPNPNPAAFTPQEAVAELSDGRVLRAQLEVLPGSPKRPLTREQHLAKFRSCMAFGFGAQVQRREDALIEAVDRLEQLDDVAVLNALASGQK
jgi:2-methylcitrate dehydratase PrpD